MSDIRADGWEWLHYDDPDFQVQYRKNVIPAHCELTDMAMHWHDDVEFIYVVSGRIGYVVNEKTFRLHAGEGLFINSRQRHIIRSGEEDALLYCLMFHPVILCSSKHVARNYVMPLLGSVPYVLLSEETDWQCRLLTEIAAMQSHARQRYGHMQVMIALYRIWNELYEHLLTRDDELDETNKDLMSMRQMTAYVQENYRNKVLLQDICAAGNVGKTKCNELFAETFNVTPMEYLRNYRIEQSAKLLEISDMSVTEIAYENGFTDGSYFTKIFRQQIGCSPQEYRNYGKGMSEYYEQSHYKSLHTGV